jgi:hypothetical protein
VYSVFVVGTPTAVSFKLLRDLPRLHFSGFLVDHVYLPLLDWCVCLGDFLNITVRVVFCGRFQYLRSFVVVLSSSSGNFSGSDSIFMVVCSGAVVVQWKLMWYLNVLT